MSVKALVIIIIVNLIATLFGYNTIHIYIEREIERGRGREGGSERERERGKRERV